MNNQNLSKKVKVKYIKPKVIKSEKEFSILQLAVFIVVFAVIGTLVILKSFAAPPPKGGGTGTGAPLSSSVTQDWSNDPGGYISGKTVPPYKCFGVDDQAYWSGTGTLAPGETYTFKPNYPTCLQSEAPSIAMHVDWSGSTQLKLQTTSPFNYRLGTNNIGQQIVAPTVPAANSRQQANLCMLQIVPPGNVSSNDPPTDWSMTLTNTGSQIASVNLSGQETNGWGYFYYPKCIRGDADGDHWNDSLEDERDIESFNNGSVYLSSISSVADIDHNGVIDQKDVDAVNANVGQGNGYGLDQYDPNNVGGLSQAGWRTYDVDGDGNVTQHDVAWVQGLIGKPLPADKDYLTPWVMIKSPATTEANTSYFNLQAYAVDNDTLTHVDFYAGGKLLCSVWDGYSAMSSGPMFSCGWRSVPRRAAVATTVTVNAYDNAGHVYSANQTLVTK